jgi:hypothetical protein
MEGIITFKKQIKSNLTLFKFKLSNGDNATSYVVDGFRNEALWSGLKMGDHVDGLKWKDEAKGIINADSPVGRI